MNTLGWSIRFKLWPKRFFLLNGFTSSACHSKMYPFGWSLERCWLSAIHISLGSVLKGVHVMTLWLRLYGGSTYTCRALFLDHLLRMHGQSIRFNLPHRRRLRFLTNNDRLLKELLVLVSPSQDVLHTVSCCGLLLSRKRSECLIPAVVCGSSCILQ